MMQQLFPTLLSRYLPEPPVARMTLDISKTGNHSIEAGCFIHHYLEYYRLIMHLTKFEGISGLFINSCYCGSLFKILLL